MCHICCLHWIAALISIFTSWNVRLWIQVTRILPWTYIVITSILYGTQLYIYLFHFNLADQNMPALDRRETIRLSIIQPWEKYEKYDFSLCGHQWSRNYFYDIFCWSWHLISLFDARCCTFHLMLVIRA